MGQAGRFCGPPPWEAATCSGVASQLKPRACICFCAADWSAPGGLADDAGVTCSATAARRRREAMASRGERAAQKRRRMCPDGPLPLPLGPGGPAAPNRGESWAYEYFEYRYEFFARSHPVCETRVMHGVNTT